MVQKWFLKFVFLAAIMLPMFACSLPQLASRSPEDTGLPQAEPAQPTEEILTSPIPSLAPHTPEAEPPQPTPTPAAQTPDPGPTSSPALLRVAYVKDGSAWYWQENAAPLELASGSVAQVFISDDGLLAAYLRQVDEFSMELRVVQTDGSNDRLLLSQADFDALEVTGREPFALAVHPYDVKWVPGTHSLAFNTYQVFQGPGLALFDDLRLVDADGGELHTLLPAGSGGRFYYSPDGRQIAIVTPRQISLVNADGSNLRAGLVTYPEALTYSEYRYYPVPVWAADSSYLRVSIPPVETIEFPHRPSTLWHIPADGSPARQLGAFSGIPIWLGSPSFSPDLQHLIYLRQSSPGGNNQRELHIAAADGSNDIRFHTLEGLELFGWAPDSQRFAFRQGEDPRMMVAMLDGSLMPLISEPGMVVDLYWVDAGRFLYTRINAGDNWELRLGETASALLLDSSRSMISSIDFVLK